MIHFIVFLAAIFATLFISVLYKTDPVAVTQEKKIIRVFGYSSFTGRYGPGPKLKEEFEKNCGCEIEFIEGSDSGVLLQRLKLEGPSLGADLVIGLDQYDIDRALSEQKWRKLPSNNKFYPELKMSLTTGYFLPYDWGALSFVIRKSDSRSRSIKKMDDLLADSLKGKVALQDPRTSSPGMQFLSWVYRSKKGSEADAYLKLILDTAHSFSPSWSTAYALFSQNKVPVVFSYVTSPLYHKIEESSDDFVALPFAEPLPIQIEFMGIPEFCKHCELAEQFVDLILSPEGQKLIMQKNYMFPAVQGVMEGTDFDLRSQYNILPFESFPRTLEVEDLIRRWSILRRGDNP